MMTVKVCKRCDKQYPSNVLFCPDCGSLIMKPDAPEPEVRARPAQVKRARPASPAATDTVRPLPRPAKVEYGREDFFKALGDNKVPEEDVEVITSLMSWSEGLASSVSFGDSVSEGGLGFRPAVQLGGKDISLFRVGTNGGIDIHFKDWVDLPPFDSREKRVEMLSKLNGIKGVRVPESKVIERPPVPVRVLRDKENLDKFVGTYHWFIEMAREQ